MQVRTVAEIQKERGRLEQEAATILGFMLFEYSRLEMELALFLSWSDEGKSLDKNTKKFAEFNFSKRLEHLQKTVAEKFHDSPGVIETYANWISNAHSIRELRNQFLHGRWGIEAAQQQVVNVVGLPTSTDQKSKPYSLADLEAALGAIRDLRAGLQELRSSCPV